MYCKTDNANESNDYPGKSFKYFEENLKNEDTDESAEDVIFQASQGWFKKFNIKNRFNLHNLKKNYIKCILNAFINNIISLQYVLEKKNFHIRHNEYENRIF
ncbi:hypothetical protein DERF_001349 [Dermatophagoides farinae]|uniref:Uncharacterized protein n=1 Tax=Dermatophagoides farinae TaxID=6954 RepID=A0A922IAP4_DERFA|nr:hypothetical protein DERF_001349 [Dermatophagoides farinae]